MFLQQALVLVYLHLPHLQCSLQYSPSQLQIARRSIKRLFSNIFLYFSSSPLNGLLKGKYILNYLTNSEAAICRYSIKQIFLKNKGKLTGKHLCCHLLINLHVSRPETFFKKYSSKYSFPVHFAQFFGKRYLQNTSCSDCSC